MPRKKAETVCCSGDCAAPTPAKRAKKTTKSTTAPVKTVKTKTTVAGATPLERGPKNKRAAIAATWNTTPGAVWPPAMKEIVVLYNPRDFRGQKAKVIAVGEHCAVNSTRRAPEGKVRVICTGVCGQIAQFSIDRMDAVPKNTRLKDVLKG